MYVLCIHHLVDVVRVAVCIILLMYVLCMDHLVDVRVVYRSSC